MGELTVSGGDHREYRQEIFEWEGGVMVSPSPPLLPIYTCKMYDLPLGLPVILSSWVYGVGI
jgi:hypothetical protein